jgi:outer membrane protein with beta-barrel domain
MLKMCRMLAVAVIAIGFSSVAAAQGFDQRRLFFGAGLSSNSISGSDNNPTGFQIFGGYNFAEIAPKFQVDAEVGYMDSGKFKQTVNVGPFSVTAEDSAKGLWATGVARYMVAPQVELIARLGYDFGDDDGLMAGLGAGYIVNPHLKLRLEYVVRDNIDSIQFNLVFYPW